MRIDVREGQQVEAGAPLMQLELTRTQSQLAAVQAQAQQSREALAELEAGPRSEDIAQARANCPPRRRRPPMRVLITPPAPLGRQQLVAASDVDPPAPPPATRTARCAPRRPRCWNWSRHAHRTGRAGRARGRRRRSAGRDPGRTLEKLDVVAPRAGRVDSLPYKLGDQAPVGPPLAILLVGDAPYARVYVPEPIRANVKVGQAARVFVDGREAPSTAACA